MLCELLTGKAIYGQLTVYEIEDAVVQEDVR